MRAYTRACTQMQVQPSLDVFTQVKAIEQEERPSRALVLRKPNAATLGPLLAALPQIVELDVSGTPLDEYFGQVVGALREAGTSLTRLAFRECGLSAQNTTKLIQYVAENQQIVHLDIQGATVAPKSLAETRTGLVSLGMAHCTLKGQEHLRAFLNNQPRLKSLDLSRTSLQTLADFGQIVLDFLAKRPDTLDISHCGLRREQVHPLLNLIDNCRTIYGFWADGQLTDVEERRIARALMRNLRDRGDVVADAAGSQAPPSIVSIDELF